MAKNKNTILVAGKKIKNSHLVTAGLMLAAVGAYLIYSASAATAWVRLYVTFPDGGTTHSAHRMRESNALKVPAGEPFTISWNVVDKQDNEVVYCEERGTSATWGNGQGLNPERPVAPLGARSLKPLPETGSRTIMEAIPGSYQYGVACGSASVDGTNLSMDYFDVTVY